MTRKICSMYWSNINPRLVEAQRQAMVAQGIQIEQFECTGMRHGLWMDSVVQNAKEDDCFLFMDIDCFTLKPEIIERSLQQAEDGVIVGVAQTANHLLKPDFLYAAPPFLAFSKKTWQRAGSPSFVEDETYDVAGRFSALAQANGVYISLLFPYFVGLPKWRLANVSCLGIATFYEGGVFHLFESRKASSLNTLLSLNAFLYVSRCVVQGTQVDYVYLSKIIRYGPKLTWALDKAVQIWTIIRHRIWLRIRYKIWPRISYAILTRIRN